MYSLENIIDIYNDLIDAKNSNNPTEILINKLSIDKSNYEDDFLLEKKAAEDFHSLCYIFSKKHEVSICIDGVDMHEWISKIRSEEFRFYHRIIIEIKKLLKKDSV